LKQWLDGKGKTYTVRYLSTFRSMVGSRASGLCELWKQAIARKETRTGEVERISNAAVPDALGRGSQPLGGSTGTFGRTS
jgi:hypothetical protein